MNKKKLWDEIQSARTNFKTDSYIMSIGEIISLYQDKDLVLGSATDSWNNEQKTKFVESILIGIPLRDILVTQNSDGLWTVIKGIQQISTILKFTGDLEQSAALTLDNSTLLLPSLEGNSWTTLPLQIKRIFRRAKIKVNIILDEDKSEVVLNQYL